MPPLPVIAGVMRVTLNWTSTGAPPMHNVLHFLNSTGNEQDLADDFVAGLAAGSLDYISDQYTLSSMEFLPLDGTTAVRTAAPTSPPAGGGGADYLVEGCAILSLHSALRGPAHRGRVFLPALPENRQANGHLANPDTLAANWNATLAYFDGSTPMGEWVIASYKFAGYSLVSSITVPEIIGTQRGRLTRLR